MDLFIGIGNWCVFDEVVEFVVVLESHWLVAVVMIDFDGFK